jgi:organic radical activating enzyme
MYRINEIFYSLQGEGRNTGRAAVFIRFSGCNLRCSFCDTDFSSYTEMSSDDILEAIRPWKHCGFVVLTGGEPSLQVDDALVDALHREGFYLAMETNGTHAVPEGIDWVTVSPKVAPADFSKGERPQRMDELKVIWEPSLNGKEEMPQVLKAWADKLTAPLLYLQPCDTGDKERNREIIQQCVEYIKEHPEWRLSLQTHKLIDIR